MIMIPDTSLLLGAIQSTGLLFILKASFLLVLGYIFYQALKKRAAAIRFWVLNLTFFALLLLPISHFLTPGWNWALLPSKTIPISTTEKYLFEKVQPNFKADQSPVLIRPVPNGIKYFDGEQSKHPVTSSVASLLQFKNWIYLHWALTIWLLVSGFWGCKLLFEQGLLSYLLWKNQSAPGPEIARIFDKIKETYGLPQKTRLLFSSDFTIPFTYGFSRPTIVLPLQARHWDALQLEMVLLHELAHIRRKDFLINLLVQCCRALYWWHPLIWHLAKSIRIECEKACDEWVVGQNIDPFDYAQQLLNTTRKVKQFRFSTPLAMAETNELRQRIEAILSPIREQIVKVRYFKKWSLAIFLLVIVPVACIQLVPEKEGPLYQNLSKISLDQIEALEKLLWEAGTAEDPKLIAAILPHLNHSNAEVRTMAAWALGEIKDKSTLPALLPLLSDDDPLVLEMAIRAIGELENLESISALQPFLAREDHIIKIAAIQALADIGHESAINAIEKELYHKDVVIQQATIHAMGESGSKRAMELLLKAWDNNAFAEPILAVRALGTLKRHEAVPQLVQGLQNESPQIRMEAARALGVIGHSSALDALLSSLRDPSGAVREMVVWALDELNS